MYLLNICLHLLYRFSHVSHSRQSKDTYAFKLMKGREGGRGGEREGRKKGGEREGRWEGWKGREREREREVGDMRDLGGRKREGDSRQQACVPTMEGSGREGGEGRGGEGRGGEGGEGGGGATYRASSNEF